MPSTIIEKYFGHSGVMGMHWGRHLPGRTEESHNPRPVRLPHDDHVKAHVLAKKPLSSLSNTELQAVNQRLQLEQQYSKLRSSKGAVAKVKKGNDAMKTILAVVGTTGTAIALLKSPGGQKAIATGAKAVGKLVGKW